MKKRMKADSVEELFEIVKAVQQGEDPEDYARRKAAERAAEEAAEKAAKKAAEKAAAEKAAARAAAEAERKKKKKQKPQKAKKPPKEEPRRQVQPRKEDDGEFERLLERESEDGKAPETLFRGLKGLAGRFLSGTSQEEELDSLEERLEEDLEDNLEEKTEEDFEERISREPPKASEETGGKIGEKAGEKAGGKTGEKAGGKAGERTGEGAGGKVGEETGEKAGQDMRRLIHPLRPDGAPRERLADLEESANPPKTAQKARKQYGKSVSAEAETVGQRILRSLHLDTSEGKKKDDGIFDEEDAEPLETDPETVQILDRILKVDAPKKDGTPDVPEPAPKPSAKEDTSETAPKEGGMEPSAKEGGPKPSVKEGGPEVSVKEGSPEPSVKEGGTEPSVKEDAPASSPKKPDGVAGYVKKYLEILSEKGIRRRELAMLGAGALLAVLVVVLIVHAITSSVTLSKKTQSVTADDGLTVTVENQPTDWCSSCTLKLGFSVRTGTISSVQIDGVSYQPDSQGYVTLEADTSLLEAAVETDSGTLTAKIEIPKLDAQAPTVTAEKSDGQITLTASDEASGVAEIRYAIVKANSYFQLPLYQTYTGALPYAQGSTYYFYAVDHAGNKSVPAETTMEDAQSISLSQDALSLFPGDTAYVTAEASPDGALLNGLTYASSDPAVAAVTQSGLVTAAGEGTAVLTVSAAGLASVSCTVNVSAEQSVTVSAIGDCTLGTDEYFNASTGFDAYYNQNGASYFFQNVKDILDNDDVTFANFEGTLTTETARQEKQYAFKGDPSYTEILRDGSVEVVTLANNHSQDYGEQSLTDTETYLSEAGIDYCIGDTTAMKDVSGIKTAFIGIYVLADGMERESQVRQTIAEAQAEGAQIIVVAFHWGSERVTEPDDTQISLAHTAIDCGADLVVGHHPHVLQGIEKYNGKYIVYSLGNFCFGGNSNPTDTDTMIFRQTFTVTADGVADDDRIEIIPCSITSASGYNDYQPTPLTGDAADEVMSRINEYSAEFGTTVYTASTGL